MIDRWKHFSISVWLGGGAWMPACKFWQIHRIWQILPNLCGLVQFYANLAFGKNLDLASSSHCDLAQEEGQTHANVCKFTPRLSNSQNIQSQHNWTDYVNLCKWLQMISSSVWQPEIQVLWCLGGRAWLHANPNQPWELCGNSCRSPLISSKFLDVFLKICSMTSAQQQIHANSHQHCENLCRFVKICQIFAFHVNLSKWGPIALLWLTTAHIVPLEIL